MKVGTPIYATFIGLLKAGLDGSCPPACVHTADEWREIYRTACVQGVQGVMSDALERVPAGSGIPLTLAATWAEDVARIESASRRISELVARQSSVWADHGIDAVLIKGPVSAGHYPVPEHRVCGDIDWWMPTARDWDKALEVLEDNGLAWSVDSDGDISYKVGGIIVEHHRKGLRDRGPEGELLLLCEHVFHHAAVSGIGLRQICDYRMALRDYRGVFDRDKFASLASSAGLRRWTDILEKPSDAFIQLVLDDGSFGFGKERRYSGFFRRAWIVGRLAPRRFAGRWFGLIFGRLKRK